MFLLCDSVPMPLHCCSPAPPVEEHVWHLPATAEACRTLDVTPPAQAYV